MRSWRSRLPSRRWSLAARSSWGIRGAGRRGVQGEQAADTGVFGVVLLAGGAAAAGDQVRVDRQDHIAGVQQPFDE
jgi:hypothetical protein